MGSDSPERYNCENIRFLKLKEQYAVFKMSTSCEKAANIYQQVASKLTGNNIHDIVFIKNLFSTWKKIRSRKWKILDADLHITNFQANRLRPFFDAIKTSAV